MAPGDLPLQHAAQLLQCLPHLTSWTRELVSQVSAGLDLSLRQYAALRAIGGCTWRSPRRVWR
ncbi:hypothetical protein BO221_18990 [Archangium sp. Cb G35]|uniref:hypothetical protein n=1 Tax=Archangium sp. Cb G35 TaxID=1920190 RepID=UPI0009357F20|nr:hypothetical protein [Archangium sp. Cb G35]OJT22981.1 hypothetical protein BO221_18990 [Archangium sp. Cb G35]